MQSLETISSPIAWSVWRQFWAAWSTASLPMGPRVPWLICVHMLKAPWDPRNKSRNGTPGTPRSIMFYKIEQGHAQKSWGVCFAEQEQQTQHPAGAPSTTKSVEQSTTKNRCSHMQSLETMSSSYPTIWKINILRKKQKSQDLPDCC